MEKASFAASIIVLCAIYGIYVSDNQKNEQTIKQQTGTLTIINILKKIQENRKKQMENFNRDLKSIISKEHTKTEIYRFEINNLSICLIADWTQHKTGSLNSMSGQ